MAKRKTTKAKKPKKHQEPEDYFIGIDDPVELRRHILEPTREVIQFLQSYEQFQKTKEEKTHVILQLKNDLRAIKTEVNKLKRLLPKSKLKVEKAVKKETVVREHRPSPVKTAPVPAELASLEKELGAIEEKLGTLSE